MGYYSTGDAFYDTPRGLLQHSLTLPTIPLYATTPLTLSDIPLYATPPSTGDAFYDTPKGMALVKQWFKYNIEDPLANNGISISLRPGEKILLSLSLSLALFLSLFLSLSLSLALFLSLFLSLSLSLALFLFLSLSLSLPSPHPYSNHVQLQSPALHLRLTLLFL